MPRHHLSQCWHVVIGPLENAAVKFESKYDTLPVKECIWQFAKVAILFGTQCVNKLYWGVSLASCLAPKRWHVIMYVEYPVHWRVYPWSGHDRYNITLISSSLRICRPCWNDDWRLVNIAVVHVNEKLGSWTKSLKCRVDTSLPFIALMLWR